MAPRWKTTTSVFLRRVPSAAYTERTRARGAAPKATRARPEDLRKKRRVTMCGPPSTALELGRAEDQAGDARGLEPGARFVGQRPARGVGEAGRHQLPGQRVGEHRGIARPGGEAGRG